MINVLDKGYIKLIDHMGDDLSPVNDARVSFDKETKEFTDKDKKLLDFLGREGHSSPFRGSLLKFEFYAPLMVARQHWKYIIGSDFEEIKPRDPFTQWNESSRRYITEDVVFYTPTDWRATPANKKQGSGGILDKDTCEWLFKQLEWYQSWGNGLYENALERGVAPEQARLFLPAYGLYIRYRWTCSLQTVGHFLNQRIAHDAQKEIQEYAKAVYDLAHQVFPNSLEALVNV